jgi:hypothetical protein
VFLTDGSDGSLKIGNAEAAGELVVECDVECGLVFYVEFEEPESRLTGLTRLAKPVLFLTYEN